jgi:hypothetical protein
VKGFLLDLGWTSAIMAERHDHWLRHQVLLSESSVVSLTLKTHCHVSVASNRQCRQVNLLAQLFISVAVQVGSSAVVANRYHDILPGLKKQHAFEMSMRNPSCFDVSRNRLHAV